VGIIPYVICRSKVNGRLNRKDTLPGEL
jgi:hypothetical protein